MNIKMFVYMPFSILIERIKASQEVRKHAFSALILVLFLTGCRGNVPTSNAVQLRPQIEPTLPASTPVITPEWALYLLPSTPVELLTTNPLPTEKACEGTPILRLDDIAGFAWEQQSLTHTPDAAGRLAAMEPRIMSEVGIAFAVCVNGSPVYAGAFWSAISSVPYPGVVMDVHPARNGLPVLIQLGYPEGLYEDLVDPRFDPRIQDVLMNAGILEQVE